MSLNSNIISVIFLKQILNIKLLLINKKSNINNRIGLKQVILLCKIYYENIYNITG